MGAFTLFGFHNYFTTINMAFFIVVNFVLLSIIAFYTYRSLSNIHNVIN